MVIYRDKVAEETFECSLKEACVKFASCGFKACSSMDVGRKLQEAGLRITRQRIELARLLFCKGDRHFTADALYDEVMNNNISISLATVYNTLQLFVTVGLIRKLAIDSYKAWYDTNISEHHHVFLEEDNYIYDIDDRTISLSKLPPIPDDMEISRVEIVVRLKRRRALKNGGKK